jgi:hypothetical protein
MEPKNENPLLSALPQPVREQITTRGVRMQASSPTGSERPEFLRADYRGTGQRRKYDGAREQADLSLP